MDGNVRERRRRPTWRFLSRVNDWGAPGDIIELDDGRIVCVYGYRCPPTACVIASAKTVVAPGARKSSCATTAVAGISAIPALIQHEKNKCLAIYYFNSKDDKIQNNGGVRHIAQSVFSPE